MPHVLDLIRIIHNTHVLFRIIHRVPHILHLSVLLYIAQQTQTVLCSHWKTLHNMRYIVHCIQRICDECDHAACLAGNSKRAAGGSSAQAQVEVEAADATEKQGDAEEEEELHDAWAPGRIKATPERPLFPPTPPSTARV